MSKVPERIPLVMIPVVILTAAAWLLFTEERGSPVTAAASSSRGGSAQARTAADGRGAELREAGAPVGLPAAADASAAWDMSEQSAIRGQVTNAAGEPVKKAVVRVIVRSNMLDGQGKSLLPTTSSIATETDGRGQYSFASAPHFIYEILITAAGFGNETLKARSGGRFSTTLRRTAALEGLVADSLERPIPAAHLRLIQGSEVRTASSGSDGRWMISDVAAGAAWLEVTHADFEPRTIRVTGISEGGTEVRDVTLVRGATIVGTVRTPAGVAVAGAEVELTALGQGVSCGRYATDASGGFEGHALVPGERYRVNAEHQFGCGVAEVRLSENSARSDVEVVLHPTWTLVGSVTGPSPSVGAYAQVSIVAEDGTPAPPSIMSGSGAFTVPGLVVGVTYRLVASAPGMAVAQVAGVSVAKPVVQIELEAAVAAAGRVLNAAAQPVEGALVKFTFPLQAGAPILTWTDADGRWQIEGLPSGDSWMTVSHAGFANHTTQQSFAAPARSGLIITSLSPLL